MAVRQPVRPIPAEQCQVQAEADEKVVVCKRVANDERNFEHHDVDARLVVAEVGFCRVGIMAVREYQLGNHVQVLHAERQGDKDARRSLETKSPAVGILPDKRVYAEVRMHAQEDGPRKALGTLAVDFRLGSLFFLVLCVFGRVLLVVSELAFLRTVVAGPFRGATFP